ncbi:MAG TPA: DUF4231 domain-containing protein [bacterium]|nr:DUF4231 domain-containing protein [bacterium]HQJ59464.1 DUF4231 domain-containing protein [bacterium]
MDNWNISTVVYLFILFLTSIPIWIALLSKVKLHPGGTGFEDTQLFCDENKKRLVEHYSRIQGTLSYWKTKAEFYKRLHYFVLFWTIPSAILIPTITPFISDGNYSKITVTIISSVTAILIAFHRGLKVEDNFKAFRHGESEFYDLMRQLLDRPLSLGNTEDEQLEVYFKEVARIRRFVRNAETDNLGTIDDAVKELNSRREKNLTNK